MTSVDVVMINGNVWRGVGKPTAQALYVRNGVVAAAGTNEQILALSTPGARTIDLHGRLATPGLVDSHIHLLALGLNMSDVDLRAMTRLDDLLAAIRVRVAEAGPGKWVRGRAHDDQRLDVRRHPTREELDAIAPDNPLVLTRTCGHIYICNSRALALAGIDENTPVPAGGVIEKRAGKLTGLIAETTRELVKVAQPRRSREDFKEGILRGSRFLVSLGITGAMEAGVGRMTTSVEEFEAFQEVARDGSLPLRMNLALTAGENGIIDEVVGRGHRYADRIGLTTIGPAKLHTDGSAGGRTAAMSQPYAGHQCDCGVLIYDDDTFAQKVLLRHRDGFQIAVHAIGDRAIEQTLMAFERAHEVLPVNGRRHRIEHCGFPTAEHIQRMVRLGIVPSPQPIFMHDFGDSYRELLGEERAAGGYPMRQWIAAGLRPAIGTDSPVSPPLPMTNLYAAVTRRTRTGAVLGAGERINIEEALACYTAAGAYAQHAEHRWGVIEPGMAADIAVFSHDFTRGDAEVLLETQCDLTLVDGAVVYERATA